MSLNHLEQMGLPTVYGVGGAIPMGLALPDNRHGQSVRVWARSLAGMQKEALVASARTGAVWRLASDEGPYLNGFDAAPCPLAFLTVGMVASFTTEIQAAFSRRQLALRDLVLVQDNRYTMEGSALAGTMTGGALPVDLAVQVRTEADDATVQELVKSAVNTSPLTGLIRPSQASRFTLTLNGEPVPVGRVTAGEDPVPSDPQHLFPVAAGRDLPAEPLVQRRTAVDIVHGVAGGAGTSLQASQKRQLHVRGTCRLRADGVKEIEQELFSPRGSTFSFLSDEAPGFGGEGRAPDAVGYAAAGIAFCFMTQLGRYATILEKDLRRYDVVQDTHFSSGGADGRPGLADPVDTHVFLTSREGADFARRCLDMGEQTCFLHALCRTPLETRTTVSRL